MAKRPPLAVILVVIVLCFALGLLNVLLDSPDTAEIPPTAPSPSAIVEDSSNLRSVLIIGIDELRSPAPELRAVWILLYELSSETIYVHGVPVDAEITEGAVVGEIDAVAESVERREVQGDRLVVLVPGREEEIDRQTVLVSLVEPELATL